MTMIIKIQNTAQRFEILKFRMGYWDCHKKKKKTKGKDNVTLLVVICICFINQSTWVEINDLQILIKSQRITLTSHRFIGAIVNNAQARFPMSWFILYTQLSLLPHERNPRLKKKKRKKTEKQNKASTVQTKEAFNHLSQLLTILHTSPHFKTP